MGRHSVEQCLRGDALYGDDFSPEELEAWFRDEEEAYFRVSRSNDKSRVQRAYGYHALNHRYGFAGLPDTRFEHVLSLGGAFGDELLPVIDRIDRITIVEPARGFASPDIQGVPVTFVSPQASGLLPFPDNAFSLATCFGTLHHIPNVSTVVRELARCIKSGAYLLVREPVVSMGDWRNPRPMLTNRERGIPLPIFERIIASAGLEVMQCRLCMFALMNRLNMRRGNVYGSAFLVWVDHVLSTLTQWNYRYHRTTFFQKLSPTAAAYVLRKREGRG